MYKIEYAKQVKKSIEKFPKKDQIAILDKGVKAMQGEFAGYHRVRIGITFKIISFLFWL